MLAHRYLDIVEALDTPTAGSAIKAHLFRLLKPVLDTDEELRVQIATCRWSDGMDGFREIIRDIERRCAPVREALGADWRPPAVDSKTGYRSLPMFAAQPQIRAKPVSTEIGGHEDMVSRPVSPGKDGEDRMFDTPNITTAPASSVPGTILFSRSHRHTSLGQTERCVHSDCTGVAATRCPTRACITHCRILRAVEAGYTREEAEAEGAKGGLVGMGCDAHEEKVRARKEREARKRKGREMAKEKAKERKKEEKVKAKEEREKSKEKVEMTEEEASFAAGLAVNL